MDTVDATSLGAKLLEVLTPTNAALISTIIVLVFLLIKAMNTNIKLTNSVMDTSDKSIQLGKDTVKSLGDVEKVIAILAERMK